MSILLKTIELWSYNSKEIIKKKKINIHELKNKFKFIFFPWDTNYDYERNYYSLKIQQRPLFIIQPINTNEIEYILNYCDDKKLKLRICNGRHSTQLLSPDVLLDMSKLDNIKMIENILYVEGGARQGQVNDFLFKKSELNYYSHFGHFTYGRINSEISTGSAESVGISGISSVGGIGNMRRTFGLTIDSIEGFIISIPPNYNNKSKTIYVDANLYTDLFYALLGGGANNFGVISEIKYKMFEAGDLIEYSITWKWDEAVKIIDLWSLTSIHRPKEFTEELDISKNLGQLELHLQGLYQIPLHQNLSEAIQTVYTNINYLGGIQKISHPKKYSTIYNNMVKSRVYYNFSMIQTVFTNTINSFDIVNLLEKSLLLQDNVTIEIELLGGVIPQKSQGCFAFRNSNFFIAISSGWNELENSENQEKWINDTLINFISNGINGSYVGFPIAFSNINITNKIYYGESYNKLLEIKKKYDPNNLLSYSGTI
jgi:hypothetical protein